MDDPEPVPAVDLGKLTEPFPAAAIKQRQAGGGRTLDYVEGHTVIHRLNDATGNRWSMEVKDITSKELAGATLMMARVALTLPGLGTREGLGVQLVHERSGEDLVKGCVTDALKKAATLFGVGLELYGPDYEDDATTQPQRQPHRDLRNGSYPPRDNATPTRPSHPSPNGAAASPAGYDTGQPATPRQIRYLEAVAREAGIDGLNLQRWSEAEYGKTYREITRGQASELIDRIQTGERPTAKTPQPSEQLAPWEQPAPEPTASPLADAKDLAALWAEAGRRFPDTEKKKAKVHEIAAALAGKPSVKQLTKSEVSAVIAKLRAYPLAPSANGAANGKDDGKDDGPITPALINGVWANARTHGVPHEAVKRALREDYQTDDLAKLTAAQARALIATMPSLRAVPA